MKHSRESREENTYHRNMNLLSVSAEDSTVRSHESYHDQRQSETDNQQSQIENDHQQRQSESDHHQGPESDHQPGQSENDHHRGPEVHHDKNKPQLSTEINYLNSSRAMIFFDLETSGLYANCDILQLAARYGSQAFAQYIQPASNIPITASKVNGLTNKGRNLYFNGNQVDAYPLKQVLEKFLEFLVNINRPCLLIAHNCAYDAPRFLRAIKKVDLSDSFERVIDGFADTLPLFRATRKNNSLSTLVNEKFSLDSTKLHDATYDVLMLQNIAFLYFPNEEDFLGSYKSFNYDKVLKSLEPLAFHVGLEVRKEWL